MLKTKIESLLFISIRPLTAKTIYSFLKKQKEDCSVEQVSAVLEELKNEYNVENKGINIVESAGSYQFITAPQTADLIKLFLKDDRTGELTQPSMETLTIIAYRGPVSKPVIEQIRGVNCSLILRNLMIRGLIDEQEKNNETFYNVTVDFLKYLGLNSVQELPDYEKLSQVENLEQYLEKNK